MAYSDKHCGYDLKIQSLFYDMLWPDGHKIPRDQCTSRYFASTQAVNQVICDHRLHERTLQRQRIIFGKTCRDFRVFSSPIYPECFKNMQESIIKFILQAIRTEHGYRQLMRQR